MSEFMVELIIIAASIAGVVTIGTLVVMIQGRMVEKHLQRLAEKEHPIEP